ncbi:3D-(3,5/4)-trihydroxycyclohexane-1,2-dione acylhydrolase (decyclizing) [Horticoccus sp. 23ND18S-11]|uniref:3D-(3,5/4)-trihydroxycyclohexane-1,2-dione acylhydrolase (decyclizing) n=1 Tax=Horticoccus sp. 23ND18S-11 TaxID=3391832 RepID=UPI0039C9943A
MKTTVTLNMAAALVQFLQRQYIRRDGVEHRLINGVWGIFGHGNVTGFGQALEEHGGRGLPYLQAKNEQGMVHAAVAYAKTRQRLGTFACTSSIGPGATNMITGAAVATVNRLPVLLLPGDIFANRRPGPVLQQLEYPGSQDVSVNDCFRPVSKYWDRINRPEQILTALPEAMRILADPAETGAVTIAMPEDVQAESYAYPAHFFEKRVYTVARPACPTDDLRAAVALIRASRRPLIVAGGGVHYSDAVAALDAFAAATGIPVVVTQAGKGAILDAHPSCLGAVGVTGTAAANAIALESDLVINLGTRLSDFTTASKSQFQHPRVRFIGVNIHAADAHKHGAVPLIGDARTILGQLARALAGWRVPASHRAAVKRHRATWDATRATLVSPKRGVTLTQAQVIDELNQACGTDGTVIHASGGIPGDIHKLWRSQARDDYHSEYGYSCMGYEIAGALGIKLAAPQREVYAFLGDGSYLMLHTEIVTAVQEGLKLTIVLVDNHGFGCIHGLQRGSGGNSFGNEFRHRSGANHRLEGKPVDVDFAKNAESLGATGIRAHTREELRAALVQARAAKGVVLIFVTTPADVRLPGYSWWDVPVSATSKVPGVRSARAAYDRAVKKQRFYY